jgi:hypothetical protein
MSCCGNPFIPADSFGGGGGGGGGLSYPLDLTPPITPASINGAQNNYAPAGLANTSVVRQAVDAAGASLTGLAVSTIGDGRVMIIENLGPGVLTIVHQSGASTAANRFELPGAQNMTLAVDASVLLLRDATTARWRALGDGDGPQIISALDLTPGISPASINGTKNDYAPAGIALTSNLRQAVDAAGTTITGIDATGITDGRILLIENLGPGTMTLTHQGAGSAAANRFALPGDQNMAIAVDASVLILRDATSSRWRVIGRGAGPEQASSLDLTPAISPASTSGTQNNYSPAGLSGTSVLRQAVDAAGVTFTGLDSTNMGDGRLLIVENLGPGVMTFSHQSGSSTAANRFVLPGDQDLDLVVEGSIVFIRDNTTSRWRVAAVAVPVINPGTITAGTAWYGTGIDGDMIFDGANPATGAFGLSIAPAAGVYTLTREIFAKSIRLDVGATIIGTGSGFPIFCQNLFTLNGTVGSKANNGANGTAGAGGAGGAAQIGGFFNVNVVGGAGGAPDAGTGGGGSSGTNPSLHLGVATSNTALGAAGGNLQGGASGTNNNNANAGTAGAGAAAYVPANSNSLHRLTQAMTAENLAIGPAKIPPSGSGSGGRGAGASVGGGGGGGGASGPYVAVYARLISGSGTIKADGGDGGNGLTGGGGGGGGGGGVAIVVTDSKFSAPTGFRSTSTVNGVTISTTPGNGGQAGGTGTSAAGQAGGSGLQYLFNPNAR